MFLHPSFIYTIFPPFRRVAETEGSPEGSVNLLSPFGEPPTLTADGFKLFPDIIPGDIFLFNLADNILMLFRSVEHTSELQSRGHLVCRLLPENKNNHPIQNT